MHQQAVQSDAGCRPADSRRARAPRPCRPVVCSCRIELTGAVGGARSSPPIQPETPTDAKAHLLPSRLPPTGRRLL